MGNPLFTTEKPTNSGTLAANEADNDSVSTTTSNSQSYASSDQSDATSQTSVTSVESSQQTNAEGLTREEADRLYEERMEDEYAKREGGA